MGTTVLQEGDVVAGFRIDAPLGEGSTAVIYRATQESLGRTVALKLLARELSDDPAFSERFRREGRLQAAIDHPHIVTVYEAGEAEHGLFLAMRLISGPTLKQAILGGDVDPRRSVGICSQLADALDAAHQVGLIHRDVKPQNVLIGGRDHAYLVDFGLTKDSNGAKLTATGQFMGTIDYVSPEQARSEGATPRSDVYQLTAVLYECLTGSVPYERPTEAAVLFAHLTEPPPRLDERRPDLPAALGVVIAKGMAKDPSERHESAGELMREARRALGSETASPT
jgi:serine/threonine protein kinase